MEDIIRKIISIDKEAEDYRAKKKKSLEAKRSEFEAKMQRREEQFEEELAVEARRIQDEILNRASEDVSGIKSAKEKEIERIRGVYRTKSEAIVERLFQELKENMKEG